MLNNFQNVYFTTDPFVISDVNNFAFFKYLNSHFGLGEDMGSNFDLAKCAFSYGFTQNVLTNFPLMRF